MGGTTIGERGFLERYRSAVAPDPDAGLVFLGNFEVEDQWAIGEHGLPRQFNAGRAVADRMDEFALLLAGPRDHVLLKADPDADYLAYLEGLGIDLPTVLLLDDPDLRDVLARLAAGGALLAPHGVSELEEKISADCSIPLAAPSAAVCKAVNSKVYSRRLADRLGLRQPPGLACTTVEEFDDALAWAASQLADGRTVVVKDAYGVSGKGIVVVRPGDGADRLGRLRRMVVGRSRDAPHERLGLVVEEWVAKGIDLTCQITIARDGRRHFDFVQEAIIEAGVPKGHRIPAGLTAAQEADLLIAAGELGGQLAADGYFGVAGVDAMTDAGGGVYPVIEINARHNMATYQASLQERFMAPGQIALARFYALRQGEPWSFKTLSGLLGGLLFDPALGTGLLVNNFATAAEGRLYGLLIADTAEQAEACDRAVAARLADFIPIRK
jgi:hypothetical protein